MSFSSISKLIKNLINQDARLALLRAKFQHNSITRTKRGEIGFPNFGLQKVNDSFILFNVSHSAR